MSPAPTKSGIGGVLVLVALIIVLLAGGFYLMQSMKKDAMESDTVAPLAENTATAPAVAETTVDPNTVQGTSIDLGDIEKDLNATDLETLSADLNAI
jgi:cbb3-type cytochrome oxidase subunit 3